MSTRRIVALIVAILVLVPALALFVGGAAGTVAYATARNDNGFFDASLDGLRSQTAVVTSDDIDLGGDRGAPEWLLDRGDITVEFRADSVRSDVPLFIGIGPEADVDGYLEGVARDEVTDIDGRRLELERIDGEGAPAPPSAEPFWVASTEGVGEQVLEWDLESGQWVVVVMNADGSPGLAADLDVGVKAGFLLPLAISLLVIGALLIVGAVALIVFALHGDRGSAPAATDPAGAPFTAAAAPVARPEPVAVNARLDTPLSPWLWLVKWFLAIPHYFVLFFLWIGFVLTTVVAGFSILFTGRYPASIFDYNLGVLRWSWRVAYYSSTGGIGTDRYPPFSLGEEPDYPATLSIDRPGELSRGLVLVKWWLLALPHYLILGLVGSGTLGWAATGDTGAAAWPGGLLGVLVLFAGVSLLFRNRYPDGLFALIVGFNRWLFRVVAYAALMTDHYPPFRLDQGGAEPPAEPLPPPSDGPMELRLDAPPPSVPEPAG